MFLCHYTGITQTLHPFIGLVIHSFFPGFASRRTVLSLLYYSRLYDFQNARQPCSRNNRSTKRYRTIPCPARAPSPPFFSFFSTAGLLAHTPLTSASCHTAQYWYLSVERCFGSFDTIYAYSATDLRDGLRTLFNKRLNAYLPFTGLHDETAGITLRSCSRCSGRSGWSFDCHRSVYRCPLQPSSGMEVSKQFKPCRRVLHLELSPGYC